MQFLLSHWHCVLPIAAIIIAAVLMGRDPSRKSHYDHSANNEHKE
jgi:hypothetical protein